VWSRSFPTASGIQLVWCCQSVADVSDVTYLRQDLAWLSALATATPYINLLAPFSLLPDNTVLAKI
jgi:hypothetical protein